MTHELAGPLETQPQIMEKYEAAELASYYSNSVDILMSVYDLVLTFGQMRSASPEKVLVEQQVRVSMSPQHVKVLAQLLSEKVAAYEAIFGPIPVQPGVELSR